MRTPLAIGLALAVALAAVYNIHISAQASETVINVTGLSLGQNVTITLDYVPHVIKFVGLNSTIIYQADIYIPGADFTAETTGPTERIGHTVYHEYATVWPTAVYDTYVISVAKAPPGAPRVTITVSAVAIYG